MRFLVDAQLPPALARWLASQGHVAAHVADCKLETASDTAIWNFAVGCSAVIITKDEGLRAAQSVRRECSHARPRGNIAVFRCKRDEGRPLGAGDQAQAPNRCELLASRAVVVSVAERRDLTREVRSGETSASEPLMTCRNSQDGVETGGKVVASGTSSGGALENGPSDARLGGGVNPDQALLRNAGTCRPDAKGEAQVGSPRKSQSTDAGHRGGAPVVGVKVL